MKKKLKFVVGQHSIYERLYQAFINGTFRGVCGEANKWLSEKKLDAKTIQAGYNSHQFHRRNTDLIDELIRIQFMIKIGRSKYDTPGYMSFGSHQVMFPLRDENGWVVNFCAINMKNDRFEFLNENGIYPCFPHEDTKRLFIATTILDAATMLQSQLIKPNEAVMCIPDGKTQKHHEEAIKRLTKLEGIVWLEKKLEVR